MESRRLQQACLVLCILLAGLLPINNAQAIEFYPLPPAGEHLIGEVIEDYVQPGDNLTTIARRNSVGHIELQKANPGINFNRLKPQQKIIIPNHYVLPNAKREGIVVNLSEMRLYYFPPNENLVITAPISIGKEGWETPVATTTIIDKVADPSWRVPKSIRAASAAKGRRLPEIVPPGPKNPLGQYALRLNMNSLLIHGTNNPRSIGKQVSSGCIRLYPQDIETLFYDVPTGTPVQIVNEPYKLGWSNGKLYLEAHEPVENNNEIAAIIDYQSLVRQANYHIGAPIDWHKVEIIAKQEQGIPTNIIEPQPELPQDSGFY
ncbi:MAG: L,D-transpeptidase [Legionellales bacterium]|nr:L,D-transpeptidase [Legionellales bacterium]|tara:strand:- start:12959 stop:13915 length:957 start_codon:yes stop_codon:yes gene_type:complete